ncbi:venom serine carboxypeptidase [Vespula maculifrons]|uniref:Venom serine carboxypeptidase n=1 Tax=Vespula maculifrons TaxID=7453 RepID=A0ABD2CL68_VESMC
MLISGISKLVDEDTVEITRTSRNYAKSTSILTSIRTIREIDFPPFVVLTNTLLIRSIRSSKQLSRRVLSRQRVILTTLASCNISRNLIYIDNSIGTGYSFTQNDKDYVFH